MSAKARSGSVRVSAAGGRALVLGYPLGVALCSAVGFTNHTVWGVAAIGLLPFLLGALAWRRRRTRLTHQRNLLLAVLALVVSIPLTRWPLRITFLLARTSLQRLEERALARATANVQRFPRDEVLAQAFINPTPRFPDNDGGDRLADNAAPWLIRYPVQSPSGLSIVREVRLWHQKGGYVLIELVTRFGAVIQHRFSFEEDWVWELNDE